MTERSESTVVPLSQEDRVRMAQLHEEVQSRLEEMARMTAQTLTMEFRNATVHFKYPEPSGGVPALLRQCGVICWSGDGGCACYDYNRGVCYPCRVDVE
jgi:hypothetical protein